MRAQRVTNRQLSVLLNFMKTHTEFCFLKPTGQGRIEADTLWNELSSILNGENGPKKSTIKWQKTWVDWKCNVRTKAAKMRAELATRKKTHITLTALEDQLLYFIGTDTGIPRIPDLDDYDKPVVVEVDIAEVEDCDMTMHGTGGGYGGGGTDDGVTCEQIWEDDIEINDHQAETDDTMDLPTSGGGTKPSSGISNGRHRGEKRKSTGLGYCGQAEDADSSPDTKRIETLLVGQQMQTAAIRGIASALDALVSETMKKNALKERQLALYERQIIAEERRLTIEERKAMAQEHVSRQLKYFLLAKEHVS